MRNKERVWKLLQFANVSHSLSFLWVLLNERLTLVCSWSHVFVGSLFLASPMWDQHFSISFPKHSINFISCLALHAMQISFLLPLNKIKSNHSFHLGFCPILWIKILIWTIFSNHYSQKKTKNISFNNISKRFSFLIQNLLLSC